MRAETKTARLVGGFMRWCDEAILAAIPDRPMRGDDISTLPRAHSTRRFKLTIIHCTDAGPHRCAPAAQTNPIDATQS